MSPNEEPFVIAIGCMALNVEGLVEHFPIVSELELCFDKESILLCRKIIATHNLANEEDLRLEISL